MNESIESLSMLYFISIPPCLSSPVVKSFSKVIKIFFIA